jgi:hypothetical protein
MEDDKLSTEQLSAMLMALLSEHWILRDRFAILESLMIERGLLLEDELDDHVPTPAQAAIIEKLRERTASAVIGAPLAAEERSVAAILARAGF